MKKIYINCKNPYNVFVGYDLLKDASYILKENLNIKFCRIVIVTDNLVFNLYEKILRKNLEDNGFLVYSFIIENREDSKNFSNIIRLYKFLSLCNITKKDIIIGLGGGVVGDFSCFAAATYLRGILFVNFPTTLLSQVDSSVGGKNAINLSYYKNIIGTIYSPSLVVCDVLLLKTLKRKVFLSGVSEIIKYAATFSYDFFNFLENENLYENLETVIIKSIKIKKFVIEKDEYESFFRMTLNFGHTVAHALENFYKFKISHGQAVAIGMSYITYKSFLAGITKFEDFLRLINLLKIYKLPTKTNVNSNYIFKNCLKDKKIYNARINICLIKKIGSCLIYSFSLTKFKKFIENYN